MGGSREREVVIKYSLKRELVSGPGNRGAMNNGKNIYNSLALMWPKQ